MIGPGRPLRGSLRSRLRMTDVSQQLLPPASIQYRIDIAGIRLDRQGLEPARDLVGRLPALLDESLALAERGLVVPVAARSAAREAAEGHVALDGGELERQCLDGAR